MPVSFTVNRSTVLRTDLDGDNVADAGDVLRHTLTFTNTGDTDALNVVVNDLLGGSTETGLMNISPIAFNDAFTAVGNTALRVGGAANIGSGPSSQVAGNLLSNDVGSTIIGVGALAGDDVTGFTLDTVTNGTSTLGGTFSIFADGSFNYISQAGDSGVDTFTYTIRDAGIDGVAGNADDTTSTATVSITITGQVWYVDSAAGGGGTGTSANPFNSITALNTANVDGANDYVYVKGNATGQLVMETGEHLIGQGASLDVAGFHLADAGSRSTITNSSAGFAVTLAGGGIGNNEIAGINIVSTGGAGNHALTGTSFGTLTIGNTTVDASGQGVILSTGAIAGTGLVSTDSDGGTNNVSLTTVTGTLALGTGALSGATGAAFNVSGGSVTTTYSGNVSQASNAALVNVAGGHTGTLTFSTGTLSATNGTGLQFDNADGAYNFNGTNTLNGGDAGVDIVNGSGGAFNFSSNSSITNPTGIAFNVNGGAGNIDYNGTISHTANTRAISVQNHTGGTVSFDGTVSATGSSDGILLASNTGGIINFTNTITINASGGNFDASGGGTITATGAGSTISSGNVTALSVVNTNIGANDLHFQSISSNGASVGILLTNTGTSASFGGLIVTGTGANDSGGSILNSTDDAIRISSARDISLTQMRLFTSTNNNLDATNVTNLTISSVTFDQTGATNFLGNNITTMNMSGSTFDHSGNGATEHGVFITGLFGISSVTTTDFHRSAEVQFRVLNTTATVAQGGAAGDVLTMSGVTFADHTSATFGDSVQINSDQAANMHFIMDNSSGANSITGGIDGILINASSGGDIDVDISNVTVTNTSGPGINFNPVSTGSRVWFDVHDNTVTNPGSTGINATAIGNDAAIQGFIRNNIINQGATGNGITIVVEGDGDNTTRPTATISVSDNTITGVQNGSVINAQARVGGIMNLTLNNNHGNVNNALNLEGIFVQAGSSSPTDNDADTQNIVRLNMLNNDISVGAASGQEDYRMQVRGTSLFELQDFVGNGNNANTTDEVNWIITTKANGEFNAGDNPPEVQISHTLTGAVTGSFSASAGAIPTPVLPTPLIATGPAPTPADNDTPTPTKGSGNGTGGELPTPSGDGGGSSGSGDPAPGQPAVVDDGVLSQAELTLIVNAAIDRWAAAGATPEQVAAMRAVTFSIEDIAGLSLGMSSAGHITLDSNAAGFNWFIDATPGDDSEYSGAGTRLTAPTGSQAGVRIDLLTTVMHELGHQVGLADGFSPDQRDELMYGTINPGERRLPGNDDLTGASGAPLTGIAFALSPVSIGTVPAGRTVTIQWDSTVNAFSDQMLPSFNNFSTLSGSNFVSANSNTETLGPGAGNNIVLDSLTLGNLVFFDANSNGVFDGADAGINGVALTLFADTNANGVFDSGVDTQVATTTTAGGGLYSFVGLAPGNYIVRVDAANFTGGGALLGRLTSTGGNDPDDNVDNDDNGANAAGGIVVSQAITLSQNGETTADGTGQLDINNTLDFGFIQLNQPPVNNVPGTQTINEDATLTFSGGTLISVTDPDAGAGTITVTLSVVNGQLTVGGNAGLVFSVGDGTDDTTMTFSGTLAAINNALNGLLYETTLDFNGSDTLTIVTNDNGNTGSDPGTSGGPNDEEDTDTVTINITAVADVVTDTPTVGEDSGANNLDLLANDTFENPGRSITSVTQGLHGFVSINDNNTVGDTTDDFVVYTPAGDYNGADSFTYQVTSGGITETATVNVTITAVADIADDSVGVVQDTVDNALDLLANDTFEDSGRAITAVGAALHGTTAIDDNGTPLDGTDDFVTYTPTGGYTGPDSFTYTVTSGGVMETATVTVSVNPANLAPAVDLNTGTGGIDDTNLYVENGAPSGIGVAIDVSDPDVGDNIESATITITDPEAGDLLSVNLPLPPGINVDLINSTATTLILIGSATPAAYASALGQVGYSSSSDDPTDGGTNTDRLITVVVNDGQANSPAATMTMNIAASDDPSVAQDDDITTDEQNGISGSLFVDNGHGADTDPDSTPAIATINGLAFTFGVQFALPSGALLTVNADGTFDYDPNGVFDPTPDAASGAVNQPDQDSFTYELVGGSQATVTVTINGVDTDDTLLGTAGADTLDGGTGADDMSGLAGDDIYYVDNAGDVVHEAVGEGNDRVATSVSYTLAAGSEVERLDARDLSATTSLTLTGNEFANTIIGNNGDNILDGAGGNDTLGGQDGHDILIGGTGDDVMNGNGGNDTYYVDSSADSVSEAVGEGNDRIAASASYMLDATAEVETLEAVNLSSTNAMDLAGNDFANTIIGNDGVNILYGGGDADVLVGLGGGDYLVGGTGVDTMYGGAGDDTYYVDDSGDVVGELTNEGFDRIAATVSYILDTNSEVEVLEATNLSSTNAMDLTGNDGGNTITGNDGANIIRGNGGDDVLSGAGGDDILIGGAGDDTMGGGGGNDTFYVDDVGDIVYEAVGEGFDRIATSVNVTLGSAQGIELLEAVNSADTTALTLIGNELDNTIVGNAGANIINGGDGDDILAGLGGADQFQFTTALGPDNVDVIADFVSGSDKIVLENAIFDQLVTGALPGGLFHVGAAASADDQRIIYDSATGNLYYDVDGTGPTAQVLFATLLGHPTLLATDFTVI